MGNGEFARPHFDAPAVDLDLIEQRIRSVGFGSRCYLGAQQETVLSSIFERFRDEFEAHTRGAAPPTEPVLVTEILDIDHGGAVLDEEHRRKQPDRTFDASHWARRPRT